ncbi:Hypothetical protein CINCED_3A025774 [Cinara cedri]|uniref:Uncharacterized protein n=1 Tax=Cinara cedri TaxID=506608 RepID=A0A5E4MXI1_9HEMI|nr:Hypothetical protein CINCED_3A025774 [Cinara cedri]
MNVVKLLAIVIVTVAVTLLCIRSGQAMAKTPVAVPVHGVYHTPKPLTTTVAALEAVTEPTPNATASVNGTDTERAVQPVQATSRSLDGGGPVGHHAPRMAGATPVVVRGKFITRQEQRSANHPLNGLIARDDVDDTEEDDTDDSTQHRANIIVDAGVYNVNRPYYRQGDSKDYSTIDADISVAEEDGSASYHNSYDLTYGTVGGGYKPAPESPSDWNAAGRPGHGYPAPPVPPGGGMGQPPYGMAAPYPPSGHVPVPGYKPRTPYIYPPSGMQYPHPGMAFQPTSSPVGQFNIHSPLQHIQMIYDKIDWQKLGILALFKVGMAKLKAFSFLKILFLLVFKLKLFLIAMFFKFLLVLKLMKFFKLLMIPLVLMAVLPIMSSLASPMLVGGLLSIPSRIIDYLTGPVYAPASATAATKYSSADPTILPSITSAKSSSSGSPSSTNLQKRVDIGLEDRRRLETLELSDPTFNIFQKVLDSEKCLERIACRMAVVEKAGILPAWVNWVLHRVSKLIPNEKLESYIRTYDNVSDEIYRKSEAPDNWETWCFERYDCDTADVRNASDTNI